MFIPMDCAHVEALRRFLDSSADAEATEENGYIVDAFEAEPPAALELRFEKKGLEILAARELRYDEELDGWYLGEAIEDAAVVSGVLETMTK